MAARLNNQYRKATSKTTRIAQRNIIRIILLLEYRQKSAHALATIFSSDNRLYKTETVILPG